MAGTPSTRTLSNLALDISWYGVCTIQRLMIHNQDHQVQPLQDTLCLAALSKRSWSSGSLGAVPIPWGAWAVPSTLWGKNLFLMSSLA